MFTSKKDKGATPSPQGKPGTPSKVVKPNYSRPVGLGDSPAEFFKWFKEADKDKDGVLWLPRARKGVAFVGRLAPANACVRRHISRICESAVVRPSLGAHWTLEGPRIGRRCEGGGTARERAGCAPECAAGIVACAVRSGG